MVVVSDIDYAVGAIFDGYVFLPGSGETDHAGSNCRLVCQCLAVDVERKGQVVIPCLSSEVYEGIVTLGSRDGCMRNLISTLIFVMIWVSGCGVKSMEVSSLRCEYMDNPLGIDNVRPQLSWRLESGQRDQSQTACRVLVASDAAKLKKNGGDLWDSGKMDSSDETGVNYSGMPLVSGQECFWKVMIWDRDGRESNWSKDAMWSMGLLDEHDWKGAWIGYDRPRVDAEEVFNKEPKKLLVPPRFLRKEFQVEKPVKRAMLYASAMGLYEMHINGERI